MTLLRRFHRTALVGSLLGACSTGRQQVYLAPSQDTVTAGSEMSYGGDGYNIWVTNNSSVAVIVTGVLLHDCDNIFTGCDSAHRLQIRVGPGIRQSVFIVRVANTGRASSFRFSYTWSTAPSH